MHPQVWRWGAGGQGGPQGRIWTMAVSDVQQGLRAAVASAEVLFDQLRPMRTHLQGVGAEAQRVGCGAEPPEGWRRRQRHGCAELRARRSAPAPGLQAAGGETSPSPVCAVLLLSRAATSKSGRNAGQSSERRADQGLLGSCPPRASTHGGHMTHADSPAAWPAVGGKQQRSPTTAPSIEARLDEVKPLLTGSLHRRGIRCLQFTEAPTPRRCWPPM